MTAAARLQLDLGLRPLLITMSLHDAATAKHLDRVGRMAFALARDLGAPERDAYRAGRAGLLHDVGKLWMPRALLAAPGKLSRRGLRVMREHVVEGVALVQRLGEDDAIIEGVREHHERLDGSGYPAGSTPGEVARIVAVADAFDAMIAGRPYARRLGIAEAIARLEPHLYDRAVVDALRARILNTELDPTTLVRPNLAPTAFA